MKLCEKPRGKKHYFMEPLSTCTHLKCDANYKLLSVRHQKPKRLESPGLIFDNVLHFK